MVLIDRGGEKFLGCVLGGFGLGWRHGNHTASGYPRCDAVVGSVVADMLPIGAQMTEQLAKDVIGRIVECGLLLTPDELGYVFDKLLEGYTLLTRDGTDNWYLVKQ